MSLLTRMIPQLADTRPLAATGERLSRPVSFVGGATGVGTSAFGNANPRVGPVETLTNSATIYRCIQAVTNPLAALEVGVRRGDDGEIDKTHPMAVLWNRVPNPLLSAYVLKSILWQQLELSGEAFIYIDRGPTGMGEATELWPIFHPVHVIASKQIAGTIDGFVVNINGHKVPLLPSEVLWLRYPHPTNPYGCVAPWRAASWAAELDGHARAWQLGEYLNGARPEGIFYLGDVDEAAHNSTVEAWRSRHVGARNALKHLFVSGPTPANYVRVGLTPAEMSYIQSREVSSHEIMLAFGVHRDLLIGGATYENQRAAKVNLWTEVLLPKLEVVASECDRQLLPDPNESFVFDTSGVDALQENEDAKVKRLEILSRWDVLTVDESRAIVGLDPLTDGSGVVTLSAYKAALGIHPVGIPTAVTAGNPPDAGATLPARTRARPGTRIAAVSEAHIIAQYDRHQAYGEKVVQRLAEKQRRVVLRKLKDSERKRDGQRIRASDLFDVGYWLPYTRDHFDTFISGVYTAGAMTTAGALGVSFDVFDTEVTAAMSRRLDTLSSQVTATTFQALDAHTLQPGVEAGESIPDLAARLTGTFDQLGTSRATTIARTETVGGFNEASRTAAMSSGVVTHRQWLATGDHRTRTSHAELNGYETRDMQDAYPNGCMFPGDPAGAASETIQCRCVEVFAIPEITTGG